MRPRISERLDEILQCIADIKSLLSGRQRDFLLQDRIARAAFERFLEIISEASRHIPEHLRRTTLKFRGRKSLASATGCATPIGHWILIFIGLSMRMVD